MAILPLQSNPVTGDIMLPGKVVKQLTAPFGIDGSSSLPSWITTTVGTSTVVAASTTAGELQIKSVSGGNGSINVGSTLISSSFEAIWLKAEGLYADSNLDHFAFGINQTSVGGVAVNIYPSSLTLSIMEMIYSGGTENHVNISVPYSSNQYAAKINFGFLLLPRYGHVYLTSDDQVFADVDYSGGSGSSGSLIQGTYQCKIATVAKASVQTTLHVEQIKLITSSY